MLAVTLVGIFLIPPMYHAFQFMREKVMGRRKKVGSKQSNSCSQGVVGEWNMRCWNNGIWVKGIKGMLG